MSTLLGDHRHYGMMISLHDYGPQRTVQETGSISCVLLQDIDFRSIGQYNRTSSVDYEKKS